MMYCPFVLNGMFDHVTIVPKESLYLLFGLLSQILQLVCVRAIHVSTVEHVHVLLFHYNTLFKSTFPRRCVINQHLAMHMRGMSFDLFCAYLFWHEFMLFRAENIIMYGPANGTWLFGPEACYTHL